MKFRIVLTVLLAAASFGMSCAGKKEPADATTNATNASPVATITAADNGKTFVVKVNEKFDATFKECVGCAKVWTITAIDKEKIETLPNTYSNRSCENCTGGSQDNTFHFQAKAAGRSELSFLYFEEVVTVTIEVQ